MIFPTENKMSSTLQNILSVKRFYSLGLTAQWLNINVEALWDIFKTRFLKRDLFKAKGFIKSILTFFILILLMLKSKIRFGSVLLVLGGEVLLEARGDFGEGEGDLEARGDLGEGEGDGDLEVRPRLEQRGDNMAARNEGEIDLGLSRELDMECVIIIIQTCGIIPVLVSRGIAAETSK